MKTELKPCPFCGSPITEDSILRGQYGGTVWCVECGAHGPDACGNDANIIAAWNNRAPILGQRFDATSDTPAEPEPIDPRD